MERSRIKKWYVCFNVIGVIIAKLIVRIFIFFRNLISNNYPRIVFEVFMVFFAG